MRTLRRICGLLLALFILGGCAAMQVAIEKKDLKVQNRMSETIFLQPIPAAEKTVYLEYRNTSDQDFDLKSCLAQRIALNARLVSDPSAAHYILQVNTLRVGEIDHSAAERTLLNGYGGALMGGAGGAIAGAGIGKTPGGAAVGGLIGAVIGGIAETVINASVKDVYFGVVTDVQLAEKSAAPVKQRVQANVREGSSTRIQQEQQSNANQILYRTRVLSTANQVNLKFEDALPKLEEGTCRSISGIL